MELRQLGYFLSAARHLSFTKAAEECCIVQSAMSQQIRTLEKELGVRLFDRTKHGLVLTPEGSALVPEARKLMAQVATLQTSVQLARDLGAGVLRVGCEGGLLRYPLPGALGLFRKEHPDIRLELTNGRYEALCDAIAEGALDCAIVAKREDRAPTGGLVAELLQKERYYAMLPRQHALTAVMSAPVGALAGETLILYRDEIRQVLTANADVARNIVEVDSMDSAETLVAAGYGVSICPQSEMQAHPRIAHRELTGLGEGQSIMLSRPGRGTDGLVQSLVSFLMMGLSE